MATRVTTEDFLEWLRQQGAVFSPDSEGWFHNAVTCKNVKLDIFVRLIEEQDYILCTVLYPMRVSEDRLIDTCELIVRINALGKVPHCTLNMSNGQVAWTSILLVEDADFNPAQFRRALFSCIQAADWWYTAFTQVLYGGQTPEKAFEEVFKNSPIQSNQAQ